MGSLGISVRAHAASATYFNPAEMTLGGNFGLSAGLSINAWERFDLDSALDPPEGIASVRIKTNRGVPIFVGSVRCT